MSTFSNYSSTVLTIKQFPLIFNNTDRQEFLEHFGATRICCFSQIKNFSNLIVADFGSSSQASQALTRLHQLEVLCRRLLVEYCPLDLARTAFSPSSSSSHDDRAKARLHGISPGINQFHYSFPSDRLSYLYPPLDENILTNINNALWSVPSFYTQVLHLMNKMSLPCPMVADTTKAFRASSKTHAACQTDESTLSQVVAMDTDDDESEIDDGEEEQHVHRRQRRLRSSRSAGRETIPTIEIDMTIDRDMRKKPIIEFRLPHRFGSSQQMETVYSTSIESFSQGFGRLEPIQSSLPVSDDSAEEQQSLPPLPLVSLADIAKHRLSDEQLRLFDNGRLYRNYERGSPSQRLYIKNVNTKEVDERILHSIYDRYSEQSSPVDIRLLRDGKMKGQAFVSFASVELATRALEETNGFVLHEKPIIVQFARSAKAKDNV